MGSQCVAGASFEKPPLWEPITWQGQTLEGKIPLSKQPSKKPPLWEPITWQGQTLEGKTLLSWQAQACKKPPLWEPITWQGQTLEGKTLLSKQRVAGIRGKARRGSQCVPRAGFEETTLMGTYNVARPNVGRNDLSEQATRGRRTWQGEGRLMGSQCVAGASFEKPPLWEPITWQGQTLEGKIPLSKQPSKKPPLWEPITWQGQTLEGKTLLSWQAQACKKPPLWEPITWQGQTLEGKTLLSKQRVAGIRGKARRGSQCVPRAGFEETTLMGTYNVARPNVGRKDLSEQATRGRRTWQGEGPLRGSQRVAGAILESTTLDGNATAASWKKVSDIETQRLAGASLGETTG